MTSKIKDFLHEFDVGARESKALMAIFALAQATIFSGVHPAWTKHGFHTGQNHIIMIFSTLGILIQGGS